VKEMMGYGGANWWWMCIVMLIMVIGWIIFLLAIWRMMKAKEAMARSIAEISQHIGTFKQQ
jgi:cytochrome oxidase assembly protein ShyY1